MLNWFVSVGGDIVALLAYKAQKYVISYYKLLFIIISVWASV